MGIADKAKNALEDVAGAVKETVGKLTDDHSLQAEGKADQVTSDVKQAGEKVKDAVRD